MIPLRVVLFVRNLGRDNPNEVLSTVHAIGAALSADGMDWHDFSRALEGLCVGSAVTPHQLSAPGTAAWAPGRTPSFGDSARQCRDLDRGRLTARERGFVADMCRRGFSFRPSPRQAQWLADILDRLQAGRAAA